MQKEDFVKDLGIVLIGLCSIIGVIFLSAMGKQVPDVLGLVGTAVVGGIFGAKMPSQLRTTTTATATDTGDATVTNAPA